MLPYGIQPETVPCGRAALWREDAQGGASQTSPAFGVDWTPFANGFIRDFGLNGAQVALMLRETGAGNAPFQLWTWDKESGEVLRNLVAAAGPPAIVLCSLRGVDMRGADLRGVWLRGEDLEHADLRG